MALLHPPTLSTERLYYQPDHDVFTVEASDLRGQHIGRVYDDAADVGFTLVQAETGGSTVYVENHVERDGEGDVLWHDYTPAEGQGRTRGPTATVRVFND